MRLLAGDLVRLVETDDARVADAIAALGGVDGLAAALDVRLDVGLSSANTDDLVRRTAMFGTNDLVTDPPLTLLARMRLAFEDVTLRILFGAGVVSLLLGGAQGAANDWIQGAWILLAVGSIVLVTAYQEHAKDAQFRALNLVKEDERIKVLRDGSPNLVRKFQLVVGDIVRLEVGDVVPADGLVLKSHDLKLDESTMTGESKYVSKQIVLAGTQVMEGVGSMLVLCVGASTQAGMIASLVAGKALETLPSSRGQDSNMAERDDYRAIETPRADVVATSTTRVASAAEPASPLQSKLATVMRLLGKVSVVLALLVFVALATRYSIEAFVVDKAEWSQNSSRTTSASSSLASRSSSSQSPKKMLLDNNLVRHLDACETMGSATTICSDKTGTLTTNCMTVVESYVGGSEFSSAADLGAALSGDAMAALCDGICLNSTAEILPPLKEGGKPEHTGNKTECALLQFAADMGVAYADVRKGGEIGHMITFSSAKKRMSVVVRVSATTCRVFTKGASEIVLELCTSQLRLDGSTIPMETHVKSHILNNVIEKYANQAYRTLCLAYRDIEATMDEVKDWSDDEIERDLTCVAIVGIEDPVRDEVPGAIRQCNDAGIVVRMVTGDNMATAKSIALKCGILSPNDGSLVMEGTEFRRRVLDSNGNIIQSEFDKIWPMLRVLARSSPKDKYTLVSGLIASNVYPHGPQVVAVTGDGTNDAPALKKADVGFAMGICGTAVAKDASDIILMDDNFKSIVNAVKWGRNVYDSISKFLQFQLTVILTAVSLTVLGSLFLAKTPLTAIQMLWFNLIMDMFASLALATEKPTDALLERKPYPRTKPLVSKTMAKHIVGQSLFQVCLLLLLVFYGDVLLGVPSGRDAPTPTKHYTMVFATFVFLQIFNEVNARKLRDECNVLAGVGANRAFPCLFLLQFIVQVIVTQFGGVAFSCEPLTWTQLLVALGLGALSLPVGLCLRLVPLLR
ncbi:calcium-translocating P-type ATPase [Saprolegnia parasitica CBS 223.65]|uniref:Calcium-transporting ATPase n=1 Tax=Saprolegnia parasitica (strain CBS 223.65) TaxID=695850 RepID=A0A067D3V7_SAPPC|nr:calcium-translocating P-type ATPase [Saprolegnia parasitica CBS 223.65]KDO33672.1 calcium-translocating P-type ATPase [Saprolegnia parasitica CBS 223.65]|eukprot:XP_012195376.1 calcium-translocating P-type ATPase [Saprolegnia parasitica CBS 223.65]